MPPMLREAAAALLVLLSSLGGPSPHHMGSTADPPLVTCPADVDSLMRHAVEELVLRDNPNPEDAEVKGHVGTICNTKEYMADLAVLVDLGKRTYRFGIFHMHFSHQGKLIPTSGSSAGHWFETRDKNAWHREWCRHLKHSMESYKTELKKFGC